jgi:type IV pilus assembly protein PilM
MDIKGIFKKDSIVGIDIGSSCVKAVHMAVKNGALSFVKAELKEISQAADDETRDREAVAALKYLVRGIDLKKSSVIAGINCARTSVKKVTVPYMPRSELREGIMLQAKSYFPFQTDKAVLDFEVMGDVVDKGVRKYEVLVGACPLDTVNRFLALMHKAGIRPASFISTSYALQKTAGHMSEKSGEALCYVDIGELHTELIICRDGQLVFGRKIPICGGDFTKALTGAVVSERGRVQLSLEEAEKIKRDAGMPEESDEKIVAGKIPAAQLSAMLRTPAESLANEIERCFDYYREDASSVKIGSVTLFGGGASLGGLVKFLSRSLGLDVRLGDALEMLETVKAPAADRQTVSHRVNIAVGAALTEAKGMNLLPEEIKEETARTLKRGTLEVAVTAAVILSLLLYTGTKIKINNFNKRIAVAKLELASLQPQYRIAQARKLAETVLINEPYWEDVFKELGSLIPGSVKINRLKMENDTIIIYGDVESPEGQKIIADMVLTLEKGIFDNVRLVESKNRPDGSGIEFEIKCWVDYER